MSKVSKTLIILTPGFPKDESDTSCLPFIQDFIKELNIQFPLLRVTILATDYPYSTKEYGWQNNHVIPFNGQNKRYVRKLFKWFLIWRRLMRERRDYPVIGLLTLWCGEAAFLGSRFARRHHLAHFCWILGQDAKRGNRYVSRMRPSSDNLVAVSDFIQKEFARHYDIVPARVIPVGVRRSENVTENGVRDIDMLGVGSLISLKQYDLFIDIVKHIKQDHANLNVVLCGAGPEEQKLRSLIEKYGLQDNIRLTGELPHEEILGIMKRSRVFLHSSSYEGISAVCIEALYAGCQVVSFVKPVQNDVEHWHIVQTKEEMTYQANRILSDPDERFHQVVTFTMRESVKEFMQLYGYPT